MLINQILNNLEYIGAVIGVIFIFQLANMAFGMADNIFVKKQEFDIKKILQWIIKSFLSLLGVFFFTVGVSVIPFVIEFTGITIPESYGDIITISMIITTSYAAVIAEASKAFIHFKNIYEKK